MDCVKIGKLIRKLRMERGMSQRELALGLGVLPKTVSKWECGMGCPDLSNWLRLSELLQADLAQLLQGEITPNPTNVGAVQRSRFYVCPVCQNLLVSTGAPVISCCGHTLQPLVPASQATVPALSVQPLDGELYVTLDHPMEKGHFISFMAYVTGDLVFVRKLYPEQDCAVRFPFLSPRGNLYVYCVQDGLFVYSRPFAHGNLNP